MKCPNCGNTRIVKCGVYYQCVSGHDEQQGYHSGCGFVGVEEDFKLIKVNKLNF